MTLHFEDPSRLWLIVLAIPMAWLGLRWFSAMSGLRRGTAIAARVVLVALLAALLAGASAVRTSDKLAVVGLVDASGSVTRFGAGGPADGSASQARPDLAWLFLASVSRQRGPDDLLGAVVFDGAAAGVATPSRARLPESPPEPPMQPGTDIARAIRLGASMIPDDAAGRLILFSDGNQTSGDALEAARELARRGAAGRSGGVRIDVVPMRYSAGSEVAVESVDAPPTAAAESVVNIRVTLSSSSDASGTLRLLREGDAVDLNGDEPGTGRAVRLTPGRNAFVLPVELEPGRIHRFHAVFEPQGATDRITENNEGETFTITPGKGSVLLVDGVSAGDPGGAGSTLARALRESAIDVTVIAPGAFPADLVGLQAYDMVILENVPADAIEIASHDHLASFVRDLGGGLIMIGGPDSFGAGGWRGTPVEAILPVKLELPERMVIPEMAIVFVLDSSGSMRRGVSGSGRSQMEIANESTIAAIRALDARDLVGVVAFSRDPEVVVELGPNSDPARTIGLVRGITPDGGTAIGPALAEASRMLASSDAKLKHIVLLSDGRSMGEETLPDQAAAIAAQGIRISSIAMGNDASVGTMELIAQHGGGTFYNVINPSSLPRAFLKIVRIVRSPLIREVPFDPVIPPTGSPLLLGIDQPPALGGLTLTQARDEPTVINAMLTPEGEPVLAHWTAELGQVAAFTSDAHRWARLWLDWPGYRSFWSQAVRTLSRAGGGRLLQAETRAAGGELRLRLDAADDAGRPMDQLDVPATVYTPSGAKRELRFSQTGPGLYEAVVSADEPGSYVSVIKPRSASKRLNPVITGASVSAGAEFQQLHSNVALLEEIARITGGRILDLNRPQDAAVFDRAGVTPSRALAPLWRPLLLWTLIVLLVDIGTRRIAWDRWISRELGADLRRAAQDAVRERGAEAQRTLAGLRGRRTAPSSPETVTDSLSLGEDDARKLARAAADRRRAQRLAEIRAATEHPDAPLADAPPEPIDPADETALRAAKRRARERFDE
ncbi:MAG: VWA domain-containing protein [Phycisphaerales bacterium]|nr:VWA domain-containing protein [Phycisphaerales bacterium]